MNLVQVHSQKPTSCLLNARVSRPNVEELAQSHVSVTTRVLWLLYKHLVGYICFSYQPEPPGLPKAEPLGTPTATCCQASGFPARLPGSCNHSTSLSEAPGGICLTSLGSRHGACLKAAQKAGTEGGTGLTRGGPRTLKEVQERKLARGLALHLRVWTGP